MDYSSEIWHREEILLESKSWKVNIVDVEIDVFKQFLVFLYKGNANRLWEKIITRLQCVDVLLTQIDIENVIDKLVWANFHSIKKLAKSQNRDLQMERLQIRSVRATSYMPFRIDLVKFR